MANEPSVKELQQTNARLEAMLVLKDEELVRMSAQVVNLQRTAVLQHLTEVFEPPEGAVFNWRTFQFDPPVEEPKE